MSIDRCANCNELVDTDEDAEFYTDDGIGLCSVCRDEIERHGIDFPTKGFRETDEKPDDPRHGQADAINRENRVGRWRR
ncbi:MAG: hypothetical protein NUV74_05430 [Candidatus Brocadiaceae bacterium]|nr:hypothetical protein [Candidatus Brocadiaceae bacterium]